VKDLSRRRDVDESIQHNLSQIQTYKKELNTLLENLDGRLVEVTQHSQKQMAFDFEMWL
jgi:chromosome segregation ATPase